MHQMNKVISIRSSANQFLKRKIYDHPPEPSSNCAYLFDWNYSKRLAQLVFSCFDLPTNDRRINENQVTTSGKQSIIIRSRRVYLLFFYSLVGVCPTLDYNYNEYGHVNSISLNCQKSGMQQIRNWIV